MIETGESQNRNFYRHIFDSTLLFTRHSSVFQIISWNWNDGTWSNAKCRRRKSSNTWYYIVICATLCVSFSSKLKATNVFPKHILNSKARDRLIQASKKLLCHVIVNNYLCNVLCKFLMKSESTWKYEIKEQAPQPTLLYCGSTVQSSQRKCYIKKTVLKNFAVSTRSSCVGVSFLKRMQNWRPATLLKRSPNAGIFPWILQNL